MQKNVGTTLDTKKMTIEELEKRIDDMNFDELCKISSEVVRPLLCKIEWRRMALKKAQHKYSSCQSNPAKI